MNTAQSYEYQAILEMTPSEAFKYLNRYGRVLDTHTTLPSTLKLSDELGIDQEPVTQLIIGYIYAQWVCTLKGGECIDVFPFYEDYTV